MKTLLTTLAATAVITLAFSVAFAMSEERGMKDFRDPNFADSEKSCDSCHPDGRGLERSGSKHEFNIMGKRQKSLEEAVNFCIVHANKGKAIPEGSKEMKDMVSYIRSLAGEPEYKMPGGH